MPKESFYPPDAVEGQPSDRFEVGWGRDYPGVYVTLIIQGGGSSAPVVAGVPVDRSAINRLIRSLRRARDAAYGPDE